MTAAAVVADDVVLLRASGINTYYGLSHILRNVGLEIRRGQAMGLLGRNGMGKTTLLRTLAGLTPARSGEIVINGINTRGKRAAAVARGGLAFVPEDRGIFPNLTVLENLTFARRDARGGGRSWTLDRVYDLFPRLAEREDHWGNQLSGGEQKMLAIGRALMTNPQLILLDEATEGLAPKVREQIWTTLRLILDSGIAAIVVDKNLDDLLRIAAHHIVLAKGEVVFDGTTAALKADEALIHRHLGV
jgi:branched-chain amino acid transport system ATP-binding protein